MLLVVLLAKIRLRRLLRFPLRLLTPLGSLLIRSRHNHVRSALPFMLGTIRFLKKFIFCEIYALLAGREEREEKCKCWLRKELLLSFLTVLVHGVAHRGEVTNLPRFLEQARDFLFLEMVRQHDLQDGAEEPVRLLHRQSQLEGCSVAGPFVFKLSGVGVIGVTALPILVDLDQIELLLAEEARLREQFVLPEILQALHRQSAPASVAVPLESLLVLGAILTVSLLVLWGSTEQNRKN